MVAMLSKFGWLLSGQMNFDETTEEKITALHISEDDTWRS